MYDFKTSVNRKEQGSAKWALMYEDNPNIPSDIVPFSVADTDLVTAPEIVSGLQDYLNEMVLGYTKPTQSYYDAVIGWFARKHEWKVEQDWIVESAGVVTALYNIVSAFTNPGEGVIIMQPVYYPFGASIADQNRKIVETALVNTDGHYTIDFADLEKKAKEPSNKLLILCSPHNPVGRVWTKEELKRVNEICLEYEVLVVSDEIHFDLIMPGHTHTIFAEIDEDAKNNCIIATAPSKTFNLAGLQTSNLVIPNRIIREKLQQHISKTGFHALNAIGPKACEIAYTRCDDWLAGFLALIDTNRKLFQSFMEEKIPEIKVIPLEGTYLQWFDCSGLKMSDEELNRFMTKDCMLYLDAGNMFGTLGEQFERMNIACPTQKLLEALDRLEQNVKTRR